MNDVQIHHPETQSTTRNLGRHSAVITLIERELLSAMKRGWYGTLTISVDIEDGHVQQNIAVDTRRIERLGRKD